MIYHERSGNEHPKLHEAVEHSVRDDELREEVSAMGKTMAEVLIERGRTEAAIQARQQTLLRLLRRRCGDVPTTVVTAVESTTSLDQLDDWLDRFVAAERLEEL